MLTVVLWLPAIFTPSRCLLEKTVRFSLIWIPVIFPLQTHHFFQRRTKKKLKSMCIGPTLIQSKNAAKQEPGPKHLGQT